MRYSARGTIAFALLASSAIPQQIYSQQPPATSLSATTTLQRSLGTLAPNLALTDVTLSGSVRRIAGSDEQSGTATLKALSSGAARADLSLSSGTMSEIFDMSSGELTGAWSGPDRALHTTPYHNLLSEPAWFFPTFAISRRLSTGYFVTDVGPVTDTGGTVQHISVYQNPPVQSFAGRIPFAHLSQIDFFIDSSTLLPVAISFNIHPDNDALLDIPVEIRFSDYRSVSGAQVPFHIQKFINGSLLLDIQIQNVTTNSGLSAASFTSL